MRHYACKEYGEGTTNSGKLASWRRKGASRGRRYEARPEIGGIRHIVLPRTCSPPLWLSLLGRYMLGQPDQRRISPPTSLWAYARMHLKGARVPKRRIAGIAALINLRSAHRKGILCLPRWTWVTAYGFNTRRIETCAAECGVAARWSTADCRTSATSTEAHNPEAHDCRRWQNSLAWLCPRGFEQLQVRLVHYQSGSLPY